MKRAKVIPLFAIAFTGLFSVGGCFRVRDPNSTGYGGSTYTPCVCDADCPSGQICDQWTGECQIGGSASGGGAGHDGAGAVDGGRAGGHGGTNSGGATGGAGATDSGATGGAGGTSMPPASCEVT